MQEIKITDGAEYCMDKQSIDGISIDLELYRSALQRCNQTITDYNVTIK